MRRYLLLALMIGCLGHAAAQAPGMALGTPLPVPMPSSFAPSVRGVGVGSPAFPRRLHRQRFFGARPLGVFPFFFGGFDPLFFDGLDAPGPEYVPVPVYVPQPAPAAPAPAPQVVALPAEPLLIEREGDRFVRYGGTPAAAPAGQQLASRQLSEYRSSAVDTTSAPELPPVILIARDGRRWETASYLISGQVLYDYTQAGVLPIPLAELDLPATIRLNREHGLEFRVPQSPHEVMLRF